MRISDETESIPTEQARREFVSRQMWNHGLDLARAVNADALLLYADALHDTAVLQEFPEAMKLVVAVRDNSEDIDEDANYLSVRVPALPFARMDQVRVAVLLSVSKGFLTPGESVVCLSGAMKPPSFDTVVVTEVGQEMEVFSRPDTDTLPFDVKPEVFDKSLELATQMAYEGREGKPVGAIFVVGDSKNVANYTKQLILNPFRGYDPEERNILDPRLAETIKELCSLDGAFIIAGNGEVVSGGTYLRAGTTEEELPSGLGARHAAAAGISASTNAIVVTTSESTGTVRVFKGGKILTEIKKLS